VQHYYVDGKEVFQSTVPLRALTAKQYSFTLILYHSFVKFVNICPKIWYFLIRCAHAGAEKKNILVRTSQGFYVYLRFALNCKKD
ncbi:hypothetical protein CLOSTMETH_02496, partial [[Clostridium] methylpentosum DSM 5476]